MVAIRTHTIGRLPRARLDGWTPARRSCPGCPLRPVGGRFGVAGGAVGIGIAVDEVVLLVGIEVEVGQEAERVAEALTCAVIVWPSSATLCGPMVSGAAAVTTPFVRWRPWSVTCTVSPG